MMSAIKTIQGKPLSVMIQFHTENSEKARVMSAKKTMYGKPPSLMTQLMPDRKEGESDVSRKDNVWKAAECNDSCCFFLSPVHGGIMQCAFHALFQREARLAISFSVAHYTCI